MGTNYYLEAQSPCECCGRPYQALHIGKSSAGWCFSLHVIPEEGIKTLDDWKKKWEGKRIFNEYDDDVPPEEMLDTIQIGRGKMVSERSLSATRIGSPFIEIITLNQVRTDYFATG